MFQDCGEATARTGALNTTESEKMAKIDELESHERELLDENLRLWNQLVVAKITKECHEDENVEERMPLLTQTSSLQMRKRSYVSSKV